MKFGVLFLMTTMLVKSQFTTCWLLCISKLLYFVTSFMLKVWFTDTFKADSDKKYL